MTQHEENEPRDEPRPPRNPFAEHPDLDEDQRPALINTKRSAALWGVIAGLVLLIFVVAICVLGNIAFA